MGGILENVKADLPAKEVYEDAAKPFVKSTGEIVGLVPRTIHASLAKLETWVLKREYAVKQIEKELKAKLEKYPPEEICEPDMAVAGPAIEAASWRSNSETIREMYVNLLAKSMLVHEKENAHPAFVEIIKQLSPDEAKIIKQMIKEGGKVHTITARHAAIKKKELQDSQQKWPTQNQLKPYENSQKNFSRFSSSERENDYWVTVNRFGMITFLDRENIEIARAAEKPVAEKVNLLVYKADCQCPNNFTTYFENLVRLNIVKYIEEKDLVDREIDIAIAESDYMKQIYKKYFYKQTTIGSSTEMGYQLTPGKISFTNFGRKFVKACVEE